MSLCRPFRSASALALSIAAATPALAGADEGAQSATPAIDRRLAPLRIDFEKYSLANGMEVILHRDPSLPQVAVNLWYHVGPANEPEGRSGFAHLFEHLMFEGSKHAGDQFDVLLESVGATNSNGTTSWDRTNYFETVPSEHLELALWLESDRMGFMVDTLTPEALDIQRDVVKNERRQSYEDSPYGPSALALYDALFPKGHPYHGAIIGSMEDLSRASLDDVRAFFHTYYAPSNATLTLAGAFDPTQAKALIARYFGGLPTRPKPGLTRPTTPPIAGVQRLTVKEPVTLAKLSMAWLTPAAFTDAEAPLELATSILAGGKASRLYQTLVVDRKLASEVDASLDSNALASTLTVDAMLASGRKLAELETAVDEVLANLARTPPSDEEVARAKKRFELELRSSLQLLNSGGGEGGRAGLLQRLNHYVGNPGLLEHTARKMLETTPGEITAAVAAHMPLGGRVIVHTVPTAGGSQ